MKSIQLTLTRVAALMAALLIVATACGAESRTSIDARSLQSNADSPTEPLGYSFTYLGVTGAGELRKFADDSWQSLNLHDDKDMTFAGVAWDGVAVHQPLVAVKLPDNACNYEWHFLRPDDTLTETVAVGTNAVISPDGGRLAVTSQVESTALPGPCGGQELSVVDLKTGTTNSWSATFPFKGYNYSGIVGKPAWAPDSIHLVYGTDNSYLYLLDTRRAGADATIRDAHLIRGHQVGLQTPMWNMDDGQLYVGTIRPDGYAWDQVRTTDGTVIASDGHPARSGGPLRTRTYDGTVDFMGFVRSDDHLIAPGTPRMITSVKDGDVVARVEVPADFIGVS